MTRYQAWIMVLVFSAVFWAANAFILYRLL
jgi:hypothetical protein